MAAAEIAKLDDPATRVELDDRRISVEGAIRWVEDDLGELLAKRRDRGHDSRKLAPAGLGDHRRAARVAPDRCRPEAVVPERVIVVAVRVDHGSHGFVAQLAEIAQDLIRL